METATKAALAAIIVLVVAILLPIIMPIFGAFAGFIVGGFFPGTSRAFLDTIGMENLSMWQLGAMLGFVGGFFKSSTTVKPAE